MAMRENTTPHPRASAFSDIEDIIAEIRDGKMVIMVDDENRENEGDLLMAAEYILAHGNNQVMLCERGIRTFDNKYTRNTFDINAIPLLKELTPLGIGHLEAHDLLTPHLVHVLTKCQTGYD